MSQGRRHTVKALNATFVIDSDYELVKELGQGAYGCVISATHKPSGEGCAIKMVTNINTKKILTKRCLREIKLLAHFRGHKNITCLYDMDIVLNSKGDFDEVYLYQELMEADLHAIIRSGQPLSDAHFQYFIYQVLAGLKYIHSANVIHRDLKPGNLLVNADCELKIADFGLARSYHPGVQAKKKDGNHGFMTEYVATRWYRAPEIMLSFANYDRNIDLWSVGCILAELLGGKPIFKGKDYIDQLTQILNHLGTPSEESLRRVGSPRAQEYIRSLPIKAKTSFTTLYPYSNPTALDLLQKLLVFDPSRRLTCASALEHPYFRDYHNPADEPDCPTTFNFSFESVEEVEGMKALIVEEVHNFREHVRAQARAAAAGKRGHADNLGHMMSRDEIMKSPTRATAPINGATSSMAHGEMLQNGPVEEDPNEDFEREVESANAGRGTGMAY